MIFACLLVGVVLGLISAIVTAAMGYGLLLALTAYMLGGHDAVASYGASAAASIRRIGCSRGLNGANIPCLQILKA